jgi:NDP-sugar pyrophosphorylase family protein
MYPVAILAGGLGTRMARIAGEGMPKVLLPVAERPFLDFKLASLAEQGFERVVLLLGHGADRVIRHVGEGHTFGMDVTTIVDGPRLLGTGGAVRRALGHLGERFWVTYGDSYLRAPIAAAEEAFDRSGWAGLMTVLENRDAWDRSNVRIEDGRVVEYRKGAPPGSFTHIDYGLLLLDAGALRPWPDGEPFDLADVLGRLVDAGRLGAFEVAERFYEVGSPEGYREAERFLRTAGTLARMRPKTAAPPDR